MRREEVIASCGIVTRRQDAGDRREQSDVKWKITARQRVRRKIGARRRASNAKDARWANATILARLAKTKNDHSGIRTTHCRFMIAHAGSLRNDQTLVELQACLYMMLNTIYTYLIA